MANPFVNQSALAGKIQGLREAKAAFQAMPQVVRDRLNAATFTTISEIARLAKGHLLTSPSIETRSLYNAVAFTMNEKNGRGKVGIANVTTTMTVAGKRVTVKGLIIAGKGGSALKAAGAKKILPRQYAPKVEFGTRFMPAEPFMTPATESQKQPYLDRCQARGRDIEKDLSAIGSRTL